jgi:alpha-L-arabinofuranosidase
MGWINGLDAEPKPIFYALQMYSRHFGEKLIEANVKGPMFDSEQAGLSVAQTDVPTLDAVASMNGDGTRLYLIVVNKHFSDSIDTSVRLNGFRPANNAQSWTLTGPSLDANNGIDMHGQAHQASAPVNGTMNIGHAGAVRPLGGEIADVSQSFTYRFVPRSVTALEFTRAQ